MFKISLDETRKHDKLSRLWRISLFLQHLNRHHASGSNIPRTPNGIRHHYRGYVRCHGVFEGLRVASPEIHMEMERIMDSVRSTGKLPAICDAEVLDALFEMEAIEIKIK